MSRYLAVFVYFVLVLASTGKSCKAELYSFAAINRHQATLVIYSSTDIDRIKALIHAFQKARPGITIAYYELDTIDIYRRTIDEIDKGQPSADLLLSSAMDLQIKLVNDGYAASYSSGQTASLPRWANWRNQAFGFTFEPAVMIYNKTLAPELAKVTTRFALARWLAQKATTRRGSVIAYDPELSGLGYMLGTQDAVQSEDFWYLARSMGDAGVQLTTSSADMIRKVSSGEALVAYNVLGSYARAKAPGNPDIAITIPEDYCLVMSRIAILPRLAANPEPARQFLNFLLSLQGQSLIAGASSLFAIRNVPGEATASKLRSAARGPLIPIKLGPGLLVYLDRMKRKDFIRRWRKAMEIR